MIKVLIADDSRDMRKMVRMVLETDGDFTVVGEAADGAEAVDLATTEDPNVIVLDMMMPVMDGLEAIPELREKAPDVKILAFSAAGDVVLSEAMEAGADGWMKKVDLLQLPRVIHNICDGSPSAAITQAEPF
ncbi:MAG TPA: response regulator [Actinomycetota bacterium]|nr:response regulator [Actinomycetota bacterium]